MPKNTDSLAASDWGDVAEVVVGEITTRLLVAAEALSPESTRHLLAGLVAGSKPQPTGFPIARVTSADIPVSVDSNLRTGTGALIPAVGVVAAHAVITGGHVLQGSAHARAVRGEGSGRRRWSHYSSRPGYVELYRAAAPADLADGFLKAFTGPAVLDLGGAGSQVIDMVHSRPDLRDKRVRLLTRPLSLRWTALVRHDAGPPSMDFLRFHDGRAHINAVTGAEHVAGLVRLCEDVALHQWLLFTITDVLRGVAPGDDLDELGPALEYLGHLWSPGEGGDDGLAHLWQSIEERHHLTRGWQHQLSRVRDQVLLRTYRLVREKIEPDRPWP